MLLHQIPVNFTVRAETADEAVRKLGDFLAAADAHDELEALATPIKGYSLEEVFESYEEEQMDLPFGNE